MRKIRLSDRLAGAEDRRRRAAWVRRAFVDPYRRERPRDPEKARLLRERGTPEHLIGPEAGRALDSVPGAYERALLGRVQAKSEKTIPLDDT